MKNSRKKIAYSLLLTVFISFNISFTIFSSHFTNISPINTFDQNRPNLSAGEITISTPENKTYLEPMRGYYPATYGFENDTVGSEPSGVDKIVDTGCSLQVIDNLAGHKNVVEFNDQSSVGRAQVTIENSYWAASNTFEFYLRVSDAFKYFCCGIYYSSPNQRAIFKIEEYKFQYFDGAYHDVLHNAFDDVWYHIKVVHTPTNWYLYIDGTQYGPYGYQAAGGIMNGYMFCSNGLHTNYMAYIDAIGFNSDVNYDIDDNLNEGLLLSYINNTNLEWQGYSLDEQANNTIFGNTTIPMPSEGVHEVQVFGNITSGSMYESNVRHFTVDTASYPTIDIITPEDKTYFEPMNGYFPATYGFENDTIGSEPSGVDKLIDTSCSLQVINELVGHKHIVEFNDQSSAGRAYFTIENSYWAASNTFEYYLKISDASDWFGCAIYYTSPNQRGIYKIESNKFQYFDGSYHDVGHGASDNIWYHIKVAHTPTNWYLHIDGIQYGPYGYEAAGGVLNGYAFGTADSISNYQAYIDALGFNSDVNYDIGDNLNEGLLISYSNNTNLDWIVYSLDGTPNVTITGNKVIPIPEIGIHSIVLSGLSKGIVTQSEIRLFAVSITEPPAPPGIPLDFPILIPIILASVGIGIVALICIIVFLSRRKTSQRTDPVAIPSKKPELDEKASVGSDEYKVCPFCFAQIKKTSQFCTLCGASLTDI